MEDHIKVCLEDWTAYFKKEDYDKLKQAMIDKKVIELRGLFGTLDVIDGARIANMHISTAESRALYEEFEKMINDETEAFKKENPEWLKDL